MYATPILTLVEKLEAVVPLCWAPSNQHWAKGHGISKELEETNPISVCRPCLGTSKKPYDMASSFLKTTLR